VARNSLKDYLNETAPRWENHSHPASPRRPCFALASRHKSLAQTAPLARATNLRAKANRVPPHGFVQEPVPERPERLAVKPSSAPALRVQASSLNETAPRWENHSHPARPRRPCFALASRHKSLPQTAPLARATNLGIKANRVPPHGFVQEPVPERPERLAVKPSSAPALRVQASSF